MAGGHTGYDQASPAADLNFLLGGSISRLGPGQVGRVAEGASVMTADPRRWMWAEACAMIERAEQMHRQFFQPGLTAQLRASWEPPVDILESERDLLILVVLPGVESQDVEISAGAEILLVAGVRRLPGAAIAWRSGAWRSRMGVSSVASGFRWHVGSSSDRRWRIVAFFSA